MGSLLVSGQQRLQRLYLRPHLALVVHRAASVDVAIALHRLEGRGFPFIQRIGRLNVIMPVDQHGGFARSMQPVSINQRMTGGFNQPHVFHSDTFQLRCQHIGGMTAIDLVLGQRGDGWNAQQGLQLIEKAWIVFLGKM